MKDALRLYGIVEIANALGVSRNLVRQWNHRGHLPPPDVVLAMGPVWTAATIEPWIEGAPRRSR